MVKHKVIYLTVIMTLLVSCVQIELTDNRVNSKPVGVALVTNTPADYSPTPDITLSPTAKISPTEPLAILTPTIQLTPTQTPTPIEPTQTKEAIAPSQTQVETIEAQQLLALVNINAYCRSGPGIVYDVIGYLNLGDRVPVGGRNTDSSWFQMIRPDSQPPCWAADQVMELDGDPGRLPVVAAPPSPTPAPTPTPTRTKKPRRDESYPSPSGATSTPAPPYP
jgi:uncharacterized protein YraI